VLVELVDDPADLVLVGADHRRDLGGAHAAGRGQQDLGALAAGELFSGAGDAFELGTLGGRQLADEDRWLAHPDLLGAAVTSHHSHPQSHPHPIPASSSWTPH
jgi:hypothetical protein